MSAQAPATGQNRFGWFGGVFTPCLLTILGVIMFLRSNFVVGEAGILGALSMLLFAKAITLLTTLSTSAIATNMQVRGGGAYYLISRVLGPEFGGAIGVMLYLAQGLSVPFYVLGFSEALVQTVPLLRPYYPTVAFATAVFLFVVTYLGAGWAIRIQYGIMAILGLAVVSYLGGAAIRFSPETFLANWHSEYTAIDASAPGGATYDYWMLFAIFFPAVTGIMAGINMSGDLRDPGRAIPRGTLAAIAVGALVYGAQMLLCGGAFPRDELVARPYLLLTETALLGGVVVAAGMFCATLSSAIGSQMGAPRVLQAVARDNILPVLHPFAKGAPKTDEPRRALLFTFGLVILVLGWAVQSPKGDALNIVAELITEFFLYTYGMLNVAAFVEAFGQNPSFRPSFRWFHWATALLGGAGCAAAAFIINPAQALVASAVLAALVYYMRRRQSRVTFGDAYRGLVFKGVRDSLIKLSQLEETPKNWRPTSLVFSGNPEMRLGLVTYAVWLEAGRGIVYLASLLTGDVHEIAPRRHAARKQLEQFCRKQRVQAFPIVFIDEDRDHAIASLLQAYSLGPLRANLVVFGWPGEAGMAPANGRYYRLAASLGMSVVVVHQGTAGLPERARRIDIWWRGLQNGGLMVILAHLLKGNWEWSRAHVRVLREIDDEAGREETMADLRAMVDRARIDVEPVVVVSEDPFVTVLERHSGEADCIFLGFDLPEEGEEALWYQRFSRMLCEKPTTILVHSTGGEDAYA